MKKIATLVLAAGLVLSAVTGAQAIDFKAKGQWIVNFDYGQNGAFTDARGWNSVADKNQDEFDARQRVRLQLDAVASEALSGTVFFEIGEQAWGKASDGGALGADGKMVKVKNAYIDWMPPQTDLKVRMGIQGLKLPSFTTGSMVLNDDVAAVVGNYKFNDNVSLTAFWARPYNDNGGLKDKSQDGRQNYIDNIDAFALLLPLSFDGIKVTPWVMGAMIGAGALDSYIDGYDPITGKPVYKYDGMDAFSRYTSAALFPAGGPRHRNGQWADDLPTGYGTGIWAGLTGDVTMFDPFRFAWDFTYGSVNWDDHGRWNRSGWILSGLFEYKMEWGIPGIVAWYASGDDRNPSNGSERLPGLGTNNTNGFSNFAFDGDPYIARDTVIGDSMAGTWGIGVRLKDMSFVEDLKHTFRINYMGGTNAPRMGRKLAEWGGPANGALYDDSFGMEPMYLTTKDQALEIGLTNTYKMYENFLINFEADYVAMWLADRGNYDRVWNERGNNKVKDAWNLNLAFVYSF